MDSLRCWVSGMENLVMGCDEGKDGIYIVGRGR